MKNRSKFFCLLLGMAVLFAGCTFLEKDDLKSGLVVNLPANSQSHRAALGLDGHYSRDEVSYYNVTLTNGKEILNKNGTPGTPVEFPDISTGHWTLVANAWANIEGKNVLVAANAPVDVEIKPFVVTTTHVVLTFVQYSLPEIFIVNETIEINENTSIVAVDHDITFKRGEGFDGVMFMVPKGKNLNFIGNDEYRIIIDGEAEDPVAGSLVAVNGTLNATNTDFINNHLSENDNVVGSAVQVNNGGTLTMDYCTVKNNTSESAGAGVYMNKNTTSTVKYTRFGNSSDMFIEGNSDVTFEGWIFSSESDERVKLVYNPTYTTSGNVVTWSEDNNPIKTVDNDWSSLYQLSVNYDSKPLFYLNKGLIFDNDERAMENTRLTERPDEYTGDVYYVGSENTLQKLSDELKTKKVLTNYENLSAAINTTGDYLLYPENDGVITLNGVLNVSAVDVEVLITAIRNTTFKRGRSLQASARNMLTINARNSDDFNNSDEKYNLIMKTQETTDSIIFDGSSDTGTYCPLEINYGSGKFTNIEICNNNANGQNGSAAYISGDKAEFINCKFSNNRDSGSNSCVLRIYSPGKLLLNDISFSGNTGNYDIWFNKIEEGNEFIFQGIINCSSYVYGYLADLEKAEISTSGMANSSSISVRFYDNSYGTPIKKDSYP